MIQYYVDLFMESGTDESWESVSVWVDIHVHGGCYSFKHEVFSAIMALLRELAMYESAI